MFFVTMLRFKFHFYKYLPDDKTRIKYPHSGVLWAVNAKSLHHMIPFTDETLKRLQVVPSFELGEGFKVLTVSPDNVIWTRSTVISYLLFMQDIRYKRTDI